jgi:hypothetical protein
VWEAALESRDLAAQDEHSEIGGVRVSARRATGPDAAPGLTISSLPADEQVGGTAETMARSRRRRVQREATQIACLACGATRVVPGLGTHETGECPRCHYLGWTYSDELDGTMRRMIMNGEFATHATDPTTRVRRPG